MLKSLSKILMLGLIMTNGIAHAADICVDLQKCQQLLTEKQNEIAKIKAKIVMLKPIPRSYNILRHNDPFFAWGRYVVTMFYDKAIKACPARSRQPTIRELAKYSQTQGAKGILEVDQVDLKNIPSGYRFFNVINPDNTTDQFLYNPEGYQAPKGDFGENDFWSSSIYVGYSNYVLGFNGRDGHILSLSIATEGLNARSSVICMPNE